jgi:hypothetical protein
MEMYMDRAIFDLKATVEATSLYILLCALVDQGETPTLNRATVQWNGNRESLARAAEELMERSVLEKSQPMDGDRPLKINPKEEWE